VRGFLLAKQITRAVVFTLGLFIRSKQFLVGFNSGLSPSVGFFLFGFRYRQYSDLLADFAKSFFNHASYLFVCEFSLGVAF
jgi:hypothetical protein